MHDIERYLLWGAVIVLFVLFLWPRASMYSGEPNSITKLAEFSRLTTDIQRLYNDQILRAIQAWAPTLNKWWTDIPTKEKEALKGMFKKSADQMVANAVEAKKKNGFEIMKTMLNNPSPQTAPLTTTSKYITEPFMPMVSGFNLQNALNKVAEATKVV